MKAYIVGGGFSGTEEVNGVYHLVTADGVTWATQWCADFASARKELYEERSGLRADWKAKYGEVEVLRLGEDGMTFEQLASNQEHYVPSVKGKLADGVYYSIITVKNGEWKKTEPKPIQELAASVVETMIKKQQK